MVSHLDSYLSATQLGITLASLALGWVGEPAFAWIVQPAVSLIPGAGPGLIHSIALTTSFLAITILHIVLGELAPKSIAIRKAEPTALWVSLPLYAFFKASYPVIWLLNHAANGILKLVGIQPVSEAELGPRRRSCGCCCRRATRRSSPTTSASSWTTSSSSPTGSPARSWCRAPTWSTSTPPSRWRRTWALARRSGHTRFPLCEGSLDRVIGLIHIKDLFRNARPLTSLEEVSREMAFVPETLALDRLLNRMLSEKVHMAAVLDEYGGVSGT